jgi:hypothetical protein
MKEIQTNREESPTKWHLQVHKTLWVRWGYGPEGIVRTDRAVLRLGPHLDLDFELPAYRPEGSLPPAEEYERVSGYAWRWNIEDGTAGHEWKFVESVDAAIAAARSRLEHMNFVDRPMFEAAIEDVRITEEQH